MQPRRKVSKREFNDIIAKLMWMGRIMWDKGNYPSDDEYVEFTRQILDVLVIDYTDAEPKRK